MKTTKNFIRNFSRLPVLLLKSFNNEHLMSSIDNNRTIDTLRRLWFRSGVFHLSFEHKGMFHEFDN